MNRAEHPHPGLVARLTVTTATVAAVALLLVGCVEYRVVESGWDDYPQDPKPTARSTREGDGWAVIVHQFTGPERSAYANDMLRRLERETNLTDLWVHEGTGTATLYRGRYTSRRAAETALQQVRQTTLAGGKPFRNADLVSLERREQPHDDPLDAAHHAGKYTLLVGYYNEQFEGDRRAAAERAVTALREAGHQAYYYHSDYESLVTVGVFERHEAFVKQPDPRLPSVLIDVYSPYVHEFQKEFPYAVGNITDLAEALLAKIKPDDPKPSMLVRIY